MSNVFVGKYRRGTGTNVSFPTLPTLTVQPRRIDLYQKQYTHDILVLEYPAESTLWFETANTGVPIQFTWRQDTLEKNWVGYVSSVVKNHSPQRANIMQILCVGGSFPLKERATRVFDSMTIPMVVQKIAEEYGFKFFGDEHAQVFPQLIIAGVSYWEWIQEQAKRIGYGIIIDGMNFFFRPMDKLIDMGFSSAAILSMGNAGAPFNTQFLDRTLDHIRITSGDYVEDGRELRTIKNVGGVDPISGEVILSNATPSTIGTNVRAETSDVLFSEYRTDRVIDGVSAAKSAADGAAQLARFSLPAVVKAQGDPRIRPFAPVFISGTGNLTDGFWMVKEAHHMFHRIGDYMVELKIATDGLGDSETTPFRNRVDTNVGQVNVEDAINTDGIPSLFFELDSVKLEGTTGNRSQANQGWNKTPNRWRAA